MIIMIASKIKPPLTHLENICRGADLDETRCLNFLQRNGLISDNSVTAADVWDGDAEKSWEFLKSAAEKSNK